jgi:hypothetical protein
VSWTLDLLTAVGETYTIVDATIPPLGNGPVRPSGRPAVWSRWGRRSPQAESFIFKRHDPGSFVLDAQVALQYGKG